MLQIKFTQCQSFFKIDMIISYILEWVLSSNVKLGYQDIGNIYIVDVRHDSWLLANFSSSHWWYSEYHPSVRQSVWFTNWISYENNHTNSKSIVSVLYKPCQPHFPYLQILEICTFPFSSATIPLNWNYFFRLCRAEPLVSMFLELFKWPSSSLNSKSYLDTFCNGAYLEHLLCKFVSRWTSELLLGRDDPIIFLQMFITWHFRMILFKGSCWSMQCIQSNWFKRSY